MKKKLSFICILMMIILLNPLFNEAYFSYGIGTDYEGVSNYESLYKNCSFSDLGNHWAKKPIIKMSALSVIRGMGNNKFYPNATLTKEQAIILLVRFMGLEDEAQVIGQKLMKEIDTGKYQFASSQDHWVEGYIKIAQSKNIITKKEIDKIVELSDKQKDLIEDKVGEKILAYAQDEDLTEAQVKNIENSIRKNLERDYTWKQGRNREEIALWIGRVLELEPINGEEQQMIYTMKDWKNIETSAIPVIEAVLQKGIMKGNTKGYFRPQASIARGEMAALLDKASENMLKKRGYKIISGTVENVENYVTTEQDIVSTKFIGVENRVITVNNEDDSYSTIIAKKSSCKEFNKGFLVYKYGYLGLPRDIETDDYVKYFINNQGEIIYVEVE
ncbi:S-layer homology domain-containing protein [Marinisporobacter balticus]|uniref:S-layer family protein n=1 Tax=Marinisporobacter balticus TaxID=2018667 RepID=A0A4R2L4J1_9FIRM|nr:S-layer homology domain-containing protein [Marinisporobacter balticus]TCO78756.1 S-layer family protein [Marinisporobacter balticus]